jgi:solute:Na+ symporter, SSS family
MPEFIEKRYNKESRTILSLISLVSYVLTKVAVTVYAGGIVFKEVFGIESMWGIDFFWISAIGLVVVTAIYTVIGGMKSVLYTSVLQTPILLLGVIDYSRSRPESSWRLGRNDENGQRCGNK